MSQTVKVGWTPDGLVRIVLSVDVAGRLCKLLDSGPRLHAELIMLVQLLRATLLKPQERNDAAPKADSESTAPK